MFLLSVGRRLACPTALRKTPQEACSGALPSQCQTPPATGPPCSNRRRCQCRARPMATLKTHIKMFSVGRRLACPTALRNPLRRPVPGPLPASVKHHRNPTFRLGGHWPLHGVPKVATPTHIVERAEARNLLNQLQSVAVAP